MERSEYLANLRLTQTPPSWQTPGRHPYRPPSASRIARAFRWLTAWL